MQIKEFKLINHLFVSLFLNLIHHVYRMKIGQLLFYTLDIHPLCTACSVSDLGDPAAVDGDPSVCGEGETPLFINGGTVCYTGTTPGSTAVYHCGEGHEAAGEEVLRCQATGKWNEVATVCSPTGTVWVRLVNPLSPIADKCAQ